jgi:hypothetical protein
MFPVTRSTSRSRFFKPAAAAAATDPFFEYVTLLLNTSATNGAQNNTFLDSSTNNFSITRNGDTTQGSFNPYMPSGYWSGYFDGTDDRLTAPNNAAFQFGTGAYTIESWVYLTALDTDAAVIFESGNATNGIGLFIAGSSNPIGARKVYVNRYGAGEVFATTNACIVLNAWNHVAVVRSSTSSNDTKIYVNGVLEGTGTDSNNWTVSTTPSIGGLISFSTYDVFGYLSNLRVVKGTAVYTAAFTPPTTPLTAITNTSLLCLQDNRFIDNSTNAFAITRNGDTRISKFAPFNPPASYSTASYGGSGYFDGTGDYLTLGGQSEFAFGTGDFTVEFWYYSNDTGTQQIVYDSRPSTVNGNYLVVYKTTNVFAIYVNNNPRIAGSVIIAANTWYHIAVSRSGTSTKLFVNGTQDGSTYTDSTNYLNGTSRPVIGADGATLGGSAMNAYLSNLRVVKGTAVYTAAFTPPTTPLTAITNTSLLLNFTNAGIFDAATINNGQTVADAQVSTTQAKWGTTSMSFDGTGDEVSIVAKPELRFGTAPFTVEMWVYCTNAASGATQDLVGNLTNVAGDTNWHFSISSTAVLQAGTFNNLLANSGAATLSSTTWTHVAFTFDGTTYRVFINGTVGTTTSTTVRNLSDSTSAIKVGRTNFGGRLFSGYIQDLRITNGYARYTANFTAPTAAFPTL